MLGDVRKNKLQIHLLVLSRKTEHKEDGDREVVEGKDTNRKWTGGPKLSSHSTPGDGRRQEHKEDEDREMAEG